MKIANSGFFVSNPQLLVPYYHLFVKVQLIGRR